MLFSFSTKLQMAQLDRLEDIYKRRRALESLILESMKCMQIHYVNMAKEMKATFKGREDDILDVPEKDLTLSLGGKVF